MTTIDYRLSLVGGPFDGANGMCWHDDGETPLPEQILVGRCRGDGSCGGRRGRACRRQGKPHVYFWLVGEVTIPSKVTLYELNEDRIESDGLVPSKHVAGVAVYVVADVILPGSDAGRELELAGVYPSDMVRDLCRRYGVPLATLTEGGR